MVGHLARRRQNRPLLVGAATLLAVMLAGGPAGAEPFETVQVVHDDVPAPRISAWCGLDVRFTERGEAHVKITRTDPITELSRGRGTTVFTAETGGQVTLLQRGTTRVVVTDVVGEPDADGVVAADVVRRTQVHQRWTDGRRTLLVESGVLTFTERMLIDVDEPEILGPLAPAPPDRVQGPGLASPDELADAICPSLL